MLTPLEIATHILLGRDAADVAVPADGLSARAKLERSLGDALSRPPCVISFSGGRDSSSLLALATLVARREGLDAPIPVTLRFPDAAGASEDEWQEIVIREIGSRDWLRLDVRDELDLVGPVAQAVIRDGGLPYPFNLHFLAPMLDEARGGSLVTGHGGDQALRAAGRECHVLARRVRPTPRDVARIAVGVAPRRIRRRVLRDRVGMTLPWLRPEGNALLSRAWLEHTVRQPLRWDSVTREQWRSRVMRESVRRIARLGADRDVRVIHPFAEAGFLSSLAREAGPTGFPDRSTAFRTLFADVLPRELLERPTKASFDEVFWNRHTREFVARTDEPQLASALAALRVDALVDVRALAEHWSAPAPRANSFLLLQACWLALSERSVVGR